MHPNVHCIIICNSQNMEATYVPINRWMDKEDIVHIYNGILLSHKKEHIWVSSNDVDENLESEWNKLEKNTDHTLMHIYGL